MRPSTPLPLIVLTAAFALAGCPGDELTLTRVVGPDGAVLSLPGGFELVIPAGALSEDVEIGVDVIVDFAEAGVADLPAAIVEGAPDFAVALTPHGTTFAEPLTLSMPFASTSENLIVMRSDDEGAGNWDSVGPVAFADGLATLSIRSFSVYAIVAAGTCPCWTGNEVRTFFEFGEQAVASTPATRAWWWEVTDRVTPPYDDPKKGGQSPGNTESQTVAGYELIGRGTRASMTSLHRVDTDGFEETGCYSTVQFLDVDEFGDWFPTRTANLGARTFRVEPIDLETQRICRALLHSGRRGDVGRQLAVRTAGLPAGETLGLDLQGVAFTVDSPAVTFAPTVLDEGTAYTLTITSQPATATCQPPTSSGTVGAENILVDLACQQVETCNGLDDDGDGGIDEDFDTDGDGATTCGADGTPGNADDDCDDADPDSYPGATELCDGVDNDCDGNVAAGETTDGDGDGVPDACDANPAVPCPVFTVAQVEEVRALAGAVCLEEATGGALPAPIAAGGLVSFSGAFVDWGNGAFEAAGVGVDGAGATFAPRGCYQPGATGPCTDNGRPPLPAGSEATQQGYDACKDVAEYACR